MVDLRQRFTRENAGLDVYVEPLRQGLIAGVETPLWLLMTSVILVLLIACVNLANLLFVRAQERLPEIAVRRALGASTGRLLRSNMVESLLLASLGGLAGLAMAAGLFDVVLRLMPDNVPRLDTVGLSTTTLAFTIGITLAAGLFFGVLPTMRLPTTSALRRGRGTAGRLPGAGALVIAEVSLAVMLLAAAGLLLRSTLAISAVEPGFDTEGKLTVGLRLPAGADPEGRNASLEGAIRRLQAVPGIHAAAAATAVPFDGRGFSAWALLEDRPSADAESPPWTGYRAITPDYFHTLGIRLQKGRLLHENDRTGLPVVVINQAAVERLFPDGGALGSRLSLGPGGILLRDATVVGVVEDGHNRHLTETPQSMVYFPYSQAPLWPELALVLSSGFGDAVTLRAAEAAIHEVDPGIALFSPRSLEQLIRTEVASSRAMAWLLGSFAATGLALAALGLFGVLSFTVARRRREIGVRMALGADRLHTQWHIVRGGLLQVCAGLMIGGGLVFILSGWFEELLFGVTATDAWTLAGVTLTLLLVGALAAWLPARRAAKIEPATVLRSE